MYYYYRHNLKSRDFRKANLEKHAYISGKRHNMGSREDNPVRACEPTNDELGSLNSEEGLEY